jgi:hypothetical protein
MPEARSPYGGSQLLVNPTLPAPDRMRAQARNALILRRIGNRCACLLTWTVCTRNLCNGHGVVACRSDGRRNTAWSLGFRPLNR